MQVNISDSEVDVCYRMGKARDGGVRTIMLRLKDNSVKQAMTRNRKKLKGTKIVLVDDLTAGRYKMLRDARASLGNKNAWSTDGKVHIRIGERLIKVPNLLEWSRIKPELGINSF